MTALTEFLLARIAEDETNWRAGYFDTGDIDPKRLLAECEAKRRIVEDWTWARDELRADRNSPFWQGRLIGATLAVTREAFVYADHPDYDPMWRP